MKGRLEELRWELVASKPAPDPRDRELEVLRAQVRVLIQLSWTRCLGCTARATTCRDGTGIPGCRAVITNWSRQQAEKEVDRESKA